MLLVGREGARDSVKCDSIAMAFQEGAIPSRLDLPQTSKRGFWSSSSDQEVGEATQRGEVGYY
jgi:hypothetical protein